MSWSQTHHGLTGKSICQDDEPSRIQHYLHGGFSSNFSIKLNERTYTNQTKLVLQYQINISILVVTCNVNKISHVKFHIETHIGFLLPLQLCVILNKVYITVKELAHLSSNNIMCNQLDKLQRMLPFSFANEQRSRRNFLLLK